ncbi:MAG: hypothetical protein AAGU19_21030 [Prolixibacteraceae bacterium]
MEFFQIFIVAVALVAIAFIGLAIKAIVARKGRFPNIHIGSNQALKERGISCAQTYDKLEQAKANRPLKFKPLSLPDDELHIGC